MINILGGILIATYTLWYYNIFNKERPFIPTGVNIVGIFFPWHGIYQSLHYFVLVNPDNTNFICIQSWDDGCTCKKTEINYWSSYEIELLNVLTQKESDGFNYTLVINKFFNVNIGRILEKKAKIRYLSEQDIINLI